MKAKQRTATAAPMPTRVHGVMTTFAIIDQQIDALRSSTRSKEDLHFAKGIFTGINSRTAFLRVLLQNVPPTTRTKMIEDVMGIQSKPAA